MAGKIFINYRRGDDPGHTGRLFDRLLDVFEPQQLFLDVDNIAPGLDFVRELNKRVGECDVLLAVIGRGWIDARDETGARRLDNPDDFVCMEITAALRQGKRVIPVLVGEAQMPRPNELPDELRPLAGRNAVRLTHERFRADTQDLIKALQRVLEEIDSRRPAQTAAEAEQRVQEDRRLQQTNAPRRAEEEERTRQAAAATTLVRPDKPSIAVLPFQNMSGDSEQEYFTDGMVEEIITALSRIRWLFVIARNSSFTYKGHAIDVKRVGRELGVRYVLEGSVRKSAGLVRITAQLIEAETGSHLWADRFDGSLQDVFDLQDKVASSVAGVIEPTLQAVEVQRTSRRPTSDLAAYDLYLRAYTLMLSSARRGSEVLNLLGQAIERDPDFGPALACAAFCHGLCDINNWVDDREDNWRKGLQRGRQALQVAGDDPTILANAAFALAYFGEDVGAMMALVDRALSLNPSFARGWHCSGIIRNIAGLPDLAIEHYENSMRLSPRARVGLALFGIGIAHFASRRFEEAIPKLLLAIQDDPSLPTIYRYLAACYAHLGRLSEARETVAQLRAICPSIGIDYFLRKPEHHELYLSGLRLAIGDSS